MGDGAATTPARYAESLTTSLCVALLLAGPPAVSLVAGGIGVVSALPLFGGAALLVAVCVLRDGTPIRVDPAVLGFAVALACSAFLAEVFHALLPRGYPPDEFSLTRRGATLMALVLLMVAGSMARANLAAGAVVAGVRLACLGALGFSMVLWSRFSGFALDGRGERVAAEGFNAGPNLVALSGLFVGMTALFLRNGLARWTLIGYAAVFILAMNSRGSLLALAGGMAVFVSVGWWVAGRRRLAWAAVAGYAVVVTGLFLGLVPGVGVYVAGDVLRLDDAARGVASGFSGRTAIWREVLGIWQTSPFIGTGFRTVTVYPHNGYIMLLAELGVVGLMWFVTLIVFAAGRLSPMCAAPAARATLAYVVAFLLYNVFESRPTNASNSLTIGFYFLVAWAVTRVPPARFAVPTKRAAAGGGTGGRWA